MPEVKVIFYKDDDGSVPIIDWLETIQAKPRAKCFDWVGRLKTFGHELHRPYADYLRDGVYELRVRMGKVNYRMLYFFYGDQAVVLTHGLTKKKNIASVEIDKALYFKKKYESDPENHTFYGEP